MKSRILFFAHYHQRRDKMNFKVLAAVAAAAVVGGALIVAAPKSAEALPAYAAQTGKACGACHQNKAGGGARNAYGEAFAANGHKLPGKKSK
jgi:mono/diheme cytochrome c family protein